MKVGQQRPATTTTNKLSILLMDGNSERRALRRKIMGLHGVEIVGASDLSEASTLWQRDRYDMVLIDIRRDYRGCIAWRNEIKQEDPHQVVAFLVGKPRFVEFETPAGSYVAEEYGDEWGNSLREALRESCQLLPQRNGFVEVGWRIAAVKRMHGVPANGSGQRPDDRLEPAVETMLRDADPLAAGASTQKRQDSDDREAETRETR